jgi:hypothetical protein
MLMTNTTPALKTPVLAGHPRDCDGFCALARGESHSVCDDRSPRVRRCWGRPGKTRQQGVQLIDEERDRQHIYEIRVRGHLGTKMLRAFPALDARTQGGDTLLTGHLPDQAAVYGVIAKLEALGLELLELRTGTTG